jgi:lysophospholipase L1-like esterase
VRLLRPSLLALALGLIATACSGTAEPPASYYLSLGDSLAQGVQPNAAGISVPTGEGYADQLYATLRPAHPGLRLAKLGCPGETTATMIGGGYCQYRDGAQLADAEAFLRAHRGHVFLVTLDIGANDPEDCAGFGDLSKDLSCVRSVFPAATGRLTTIVSRLRSAAGPGVRIIGMNYYLPAISSWHSGFLGQEAARLVARLTASYNQALEGVYAKYSMPVADVFGAFATSDFGDTQAVPGLGQVPRNVALLCRWTWQCAAPPRGPNQHANQAGYAVIAAAFARAGGLH